VIFVSDDGKISGFVCGPRGKRRDVRSCAFCTTIHTLLCDFKVGGKTCDKPLCARHAVKIAREVDYCPDHPR
jgi:hypothetical protein